MLLPKIYTEHIPGKKYAVPKPHPLCKAKSTYVEYFVVLGRKIDYIFGSVLKGILTTF